MSIRIFAPKSDDFLEYFILKRIKKINFHAKNLDFDPKLNLQNIQKSQYWPKTLLLSRHTWIFAPKSEDILEYFILKRIKKLNFHAKNLDFDPKLNLQNIEKMSLSLIGNEKSRRFFWIFQPFKVSKNWIFMPKI